jgi:hypothetical protein
MAFDCHSQNSVNLFKKQGCSVYYPPVLNSITLFTWFLIKTGTSWQGLAVRPAVIQTAPLLHAHRHGKKESVQVVNLIAQGTIEERMLNTLAGKRTVFAGVFGKAEAPESIRFEDGGQALLKQLDKLLDEQRQPDWSDQCETPYLPDVDSHSQER